MITGNDIKRAQSLICTDADGQGTYLFGSLVNIQTNIHLLAVKSQIEQKHSFIYHNLSHITQDFWNIGILIARIEWTRQYAVEHPDFLDAWRAFVSVDIGQFHVEYRSIFDYAASTLRLTAKSPNSVPQKYGKLYEWTKKGLENNRIGQLGRSAANLILSSSWFMDFRDIRDAMVHRGANTFVFGVPEDGTLFQIFDPDYSSKRVQGNIFLVNENVADFELYSAFWLTHLLLFLEDFATIISESLGLELFPGSKLYSRGLNVTRHWMDKLAEKISG